MNDDVEVVGDDTVRATVSLWRGDDRVATLEPRIVSHPDRGVELAETSLRSTPLTDVQVVLPTPATTVGPSSRSTSARWCGSSWWGGLRWRRRPWWPAARPGVWATGNRSAAPWRRQDRGPVTSSRARSARRPARGSYGTAAARSAGSAAERLGGGVGARLWASEISGRSP